MRVAIALGGTDRGVSGIGVYVRAVLPPLSARVRSGGGSLVALGTKADLDAYAKDGALEIDRVELPSSVDAPAASALWHLASAGHAARRAGADVLLLPAANRRMPMLSPVPTVAVVHDLAQLRVQKKYDPLRMVYVNHVLTRALHGARELVAVSGATRDDMANVLGLPRGRIRVVSNGVDVARFTPPREGDPRVARAREEAALEGPYLLYTARLEHPGKNHIRLLRAFAASGARASHVLALAGKDWSAERMIRGEIKSLGLEGRVRLLGFVPDDLLPGLVAGADAVVMVGLHEGFGLPALEALAAGRAVIASSSGALPEVVGPLAALCDPLDERSIAEALGRALTDASLRGRVADEGPLWASRFTWDSTAEGLYDACRAAARGADASDVSDVSDISSAGGASGAARARGASELFPRARLKDVLRGRASLVGSRLDSAAPRGLVSPVESRVHLGIPYGDLAAEEALLLAVRSPKRDAAVLLRAVIGAALAPPAGAVAAPRPTIVSARVHNTTIDAALDAILESPPRPGARMVHFVHPHALNLASSDPDLARLLDAADLVLPDGIGIRVAAALLGVAMRHNLNGTDLLPLLCRRAADEGVPLALIGAEPGVADACAERLKAAAPGLSIPLTSHGFLDDEASRALSDRLRALGRSVVLVGMGSPIQERWSWRHLRDVPDVTVLTVGGLFDFFSGRIPRAPLALRELGLEWVYRLAQEPRRLMKRYLLGNPLFLLRALRQRALGPAPA
jgi:N-acetylglucosaminyldiphosphoundecaprenol N-acetyl-beta-D-mannosaminyltransferase